MRLLALASLLATVLLVPMAALADVGPPPSCPEGTHREYDRGYHCVPDDAPIAEGPTAEPTPSAAPDATTTATAATTTAPATTAPALTAAPSPPASPSSHACGCTTAGGDAKGDHLALSLSAAFVLAIGARRRRARALT